MFPTHPKGWPFRLLGHAVPCASRRPRCSRGPVPAPGRSAKPGDTDLCWLKSGSGACRRGSKKLVHGACAGCSTVGLYRRGGAVCLARTLLPSSCVATLVWNCICAPSSAVKRMAVRVSLRRTRERRCFLAGDCPNLMHNLQGGEMEELTVDHRLKYTHAAMHGQNYRVGRGEEA